MAHAGIEVEWLEDEPGWSVEEPPVEPVRVVLAEVVSAVEEVRSEDGIDVSGGARRQRRFELWRRGGGRRGEGGPGASRGVQYSEITLSMKQKK